MSAVSQISDGQPQGPVASTSLPTESSTSWSSSITEEVSSWPTSSYENPFTIYTSMTNSLGVITGMPSVVTSQPTQPAVITSQPVSPTLPSYSGYYYGNGSSTTSAQSISSGPTTLVTSTVGESPYNGVSTTSSGTSMATFAQVTGAAVTNRVAGACLGLLVAALGFSLL
ncbi:uncharacterized protein Z519_03851 [Cladophialophora bantiana CBS 173.52]|uniref:REJ domain-containing protein n=1 Tax=Cladophialophora bantiana (strain ATCC 10958 / CBS 173.52 / CDC B-1940 / NIH 8579) TaxID=1442370 RepID=A0A0D2G9F9_CLAB1|nr:uncharacterized protein Z519_03851 [Cladophialophora bantiana CBS 173.52]KIW95267.1 hypothetical protein Z519_03851 [Cladophialophora bantiana CBS 173.52]